MRYADAEGRPWGTPGAPARIPSIRDGVDQKAWLCGPPRQVIEGIRYFESRYPGLDQMMIHWAEGMGPKEFKEQLTWFAREVMPAFPPGVSPPGVYPLPVVPPRGGAPRDCIFPLRSLVESR